MSDSAALAAAAFFSASFNASFVLKYPTVTATANAPAARFANVLSAASAGLRLAHSRKRRIGDGGAELHLCGVCTSICVLSNAAILRARFPDATIVVHADATADVTPEMKVHALAVLGSIQCDVV